MRGIMLAKVIAALALPQAMEQSKPANYRTAAKLKKTVHDVDRIDAAENKRAKRKARNLKGLK